MQSRWCTFLVSAMSEPLNAQTVLCRGSEQLRDMFVSEPCSFRIKKAQGTWLAFSAFGLKDFLVVTVMV